VLNLSFFISKAADEAVDNLVPGEAGGDMAGPRGRCLRPPACIVDRLGHQRDEVIEPGLELRHLLVVVAAELVFLRFDPASE
jgi:hypothetical protein